MCSPKSENGWRGRIFTWRAARLWRFTSATDVQSIWIGSLSTPFLIQCCLPSACRDAGLSFETGQTAPGTLNGKANGVRLSLMEFRYPLLQPLELWSDLGVALAGLDDLACMKLSAIAQRGSRKDFYDVHALLTRHRPLVELLQLYQEKFNVSDISPVLYGLAYFDDAEDEPEPILLQKVRWKQVKTDVLRWLKEVVQSH